MDEAINADLNTGTTFKVSEGVDPVAVDLGNPDRHDLSVAYRLQMSRAERAGEGRFPPTPALIQTGGRPAHGRGVRRLHARPAVLVLGNLSRAKSLQESSYAI